MSRLRFVGALLAIGVSVLCIVASVKHSDQAHATISPKAALVGEQPR